MYVCEYCVCIQTRTCIHVVILYINNDVCVSLYDFNSHVMLLQFNYDIIGGNFGTIKSTLACTELTLRCILGHSGSYMYSLIYGELTLVGEKFLACYMLTQGSFGKQWYAVSYTTCFLSCPSY